LTSREVPVPRRGFQFHQPPELGGAAEAALNFNPTNANFGKVTTKGGGVVEANATYSFASFYF